jgi:hypothetical protein
VTCAGCPGNDREPDSGLQTHTISRTSHTPERPEDLGASVLTFWESKSKQANKNSVWLRPRQIQCENLGSYSSSRTWVAHRGILRSGPRADVELRALD